MTIDWKAVQQYFTVVLFVFQFYPVCNFGKFISLGLGTVRSEGDNIINYNCTSLEHEQGSAFAGRNFSLSFFFGFCPHFVR